MEDLSLWTAGLLLLGGFAAGFINTVAGGGSAITVPILIELLGSATLANGTNRVGVLLQSLVGIGRFQKGGKVPWKRTLPLVPSAVIGGLIGSKIASELSPDLMKRVFGVVIVLVAASVVFKPTAWSGGSGERLKEPWLSIVFFLIGVYGGFVQAGVGFLLLAGLVVGLGMDLVSGNAAKLVIVVAFTAVALPVFMAAGQVRWVVGVVLAGGNMLGAYVAAHFAVNKGAGWMRWALVGAALVAAGRMLFF
jgi:uncharacterized membrane protein YfcA